MVKVTQMMQSIDKNEDDSGEHLDIIIADNEKSILLNITKYIFEENELQISCCNHIENPEKCLKNKTISYRESNVKPERIEKALMFCLEEF